MKYSPELTFAKIITVYNTCFESRLGEGGGKRIVQRTFLNKNEEGTVIDFYNQIYLPSMKKYLLKSKYIQVSTSSSLAKHDKKVECNDREGTNDTEAKHPSERSHDVMKLQNSNFRFNIRHCEDQMPKKESPKSRVLYSFGATSTTEVSFFY